MNAYVFLKPEEMSGYDMYVTILQHFQGDDFGKHDAIDTVIKFGHLHFGKNSTSSPETFLAKILDCLKRMSREDAIPASPGHVLPEGHPSTVSTMGCP